jgi:hypothetical protein
MIGMQVIQHFVVFFCELIVIAAKVTLLIIGLKGEVSEFSVHLLHTLSEITIVPLKEFFGIVVFHRLNIHQLLVMINLSLSLFLLSCKQGPAGLLWVLKLVDIDYLWADGVS